MPAGPFGLHVHTTKQIFTEVKNLATSLLIICQNEKNPVIFRKNTHALRTCGNAETHRFLPYCELSCVLSSRRFKLSLRNNFGHNGSTFFVSSKALGPKMLLIGKNRIQCTSSFVLIYNLA